MLWLIALAVGVFVAFIQYGWRDLRTGSLAVLAALMRVAAVTLLLALLLDAPLGRGAALRPWVALDLSESMTRAAARDSVVWRRAGEIVRRARAESVLVFGDSARPARAGALPRDASSALRPLVERALGAGHPLVIVTDGELDDPDAAQSLPAGSRLEVIARPARPDLALVSVDAPRAVVSGDTVEMGVTVTAGNAGAASATFTLALDGAVLAMQNIPALPPYAERAVTLRTVVSGAPGSAVLRAFVTSPGDAEPRNDTLLTSVDLARAPSAVFASTAPDFDARYALEVLHGTLSIPTRGFFRVAPGQWRLEGPLTPVPESEVRAAIRDAPVVILHGDTAAFGPLSTLTSGPLALITPGSGGEGEWYPSAAPPSPLATSLAGVPWDSLPPVSVPVNAPRGEWQAVVARRQRGSEQQALVIGSDEPRRIVVAASGLWRWRFRGGVSSDAFTALWGSIFDWLAAERADKRGAVPDERSLREGEPVRWRRGSSADSVVRVVLRRRGVNGTAVARVDSLLLRFTPGTSVVETPPLASGIYDVSVRGGAAVLTVNASRELLPRRPSVQSGRSRGVARADTARSLRSAGWAYALVIVLLCAEWILRRRRGMR